MFLLACIFLIWMVVFLLSRAFSSGSSSRPEELKRADLSSYESSTASVYIDGPIVLDQEHHALRITVDHNEARIQKIVGYEGRVEEERSYPKTTDSYVVFLKALEQAAFMDGDTTSKETEVGKCPQNNRYVFALENSGEQVFRYWKTPCGQGTFNGDAEQTMWLFRSQIPSKDFSDITNDLLMSY